MAFTLKYLPNDRIAKQLNQPEKHDYNHDILDQFLKAHKDHPGVVSERETVDLGLMVVVPASEAVYVAAFYLPTKERKFLKLIAAPCTGGLQ